MQTKYLQERKEGTQVVRIHDESVAVLLCDVVVDKSIGELTPICAYHNIQKHEQTNTIVLE